MGPYEFFAYVAFLLAAGGVGYIVAIWRHADRIIPTDLPDMEEEMARDLCDTYYLTVDPKRPIRDAFDKVSERTRNHWRAQAVLLSVKGWRRP